MRQTPPAEFARLGITGNVLCVRGGREWHTACPQCGGKDRFRIHTDHPFPKWNYECRQCGLKGWADQLDATLRENSDPARLEYLRHAEAERAALEAAKASFDAQRLEKIDTLDTKAGTALLIAESAEMLYRPQVEANFQTHCHAYKLAATILARQVAERLTIG